MKIVHPRERDRQAIRDADEATKRETRKRAPWWRRVLMLAVGVVMLGGALGACSNRPPRSCNGWSGPCAPIDWHTAP